MMGMNRIGLVVGLFAALGVFLRGGEQAFASNGPAAISAEELDRIPVIDIDPLDLDAIGQEDVQRQAAGLPPRFAIPHVVAVKPASHGVWLDRDDGMRVWRLRVRSAGAASINLGFGSYVMSPGGRTAARLFHRSTRFDSSLHGAG